jgi:hypothetical protein
MKQISERKRAKVTGKGAALPHLGIPHWIVRRDEFAATPGSALKLLIDLADQYNGFNNGNLSIAQIRPRWSSRSKAKRAMDYLIENGWIVKTKQGGLGIGPDLFAVTWWQVDDCKGKHDYPVESRPSHLWMKNKTPDPNQVRGVPESGTAIAPETPKIGPVVPESGTRSAIFRAA